MFENKTKILIAFLALSTLVLLIFVLTNRNEADRDPSKPLPSTIEDHSFYPIYNNISEEPLPVTGFVKVQFNSDFNLEDLTYAVDPIIQIEVSKDDSNNKTVVFSPAQQWDFNSEYKLTINKKSKNIYRNELKEEIVIKFKTHPYKGI